MTRKALGNSHRESVSLLELMDMFPDEDTTRKWFGKYAGQTG